MFNKFIFFGTFLFLIASTLGAQQQFQDVVYLKNGSIVRGIIIEQFPNISIKIQTKDQNVFVYKIDDILKMTKESAIANGANGDQNISTQQQSVGSEQQGIPLQPQNINTKHQDIGSEQQEIRPQQHNNDSHQSTPFLTEFGGKLGIGISSLYGPNVKNTAAKVGLNFYGFAEKEFTPMFAGQIEIGFTRKGCNFDIPKDTNDQSIGLSYLEIPIQAKFLIPVSAPFKPAVYAGPVLGFNLAATEFYNNKSYPENNINNFDFGLAFGAVTEIPIQQIGNILLDIRYTLGLSNVSSSSNSNNAIRNGNFAILAGYAFKLPK